MTTCVKKRALAMVKREESHLDTEGWLFADNDHITGMADLADGEATAGREDYGDLMPMFARLGESTFRAKFHLKPKDRAYIMAKGFTTVRSHAADFVAKRLAPAFPSNDGKQTPMRGHPVFVAQHATGCCCRGCLAKWHGISQGHELTRQERDYVLHVLMGWITREMDSTA